MSKSKKTRRECDRPKGPQLTKTKAHQRRAVERKLPKRLTLANNEQVPRGPPPIVPDVMTVTEFCARYLISRETFYARITEMPRSFKIGARRYIPIEAVETWRAALMAQEAQALEVVAS